MSKLQTHRDTWQPIRCSAGRSFLKPPWKAGASKLDTRRTCQVCSLRDVKLTSKAEVQRQALLSPNLFKAVTWAVRREPQLRAWTETHAVSTAQQML